MSSLMNEAKELMKLWGWFRPARVLLTANNYRIFDHLEKQLSAKDLSKKLKTDLRATEILLDALSGMGVLKKNKNIYSNAPLASKFLVSGKPHYQGDIIRHADNLWQNWSGLDEVMKTGKPYRKAHDHKSFILGMHNLASLKAKDVIKSVGIKGVKTALDLGGGPGTYSIEMARHGVHITLFDRPETVDIAMDVTGKAGMKNIDFMTGDFLYDDIGKGYDLIFASQILHSCSEKESKNLLKKCRKALNKNGRLVIQEFYLEKDRAHPVNSSLFSVNMLVNTPGGRGYSLHEMKKWLLKTGFRKIKEKLMGDTVLIQAVKL
ncbi:MAG: methyltransferase domain-containing protein [Nitrospirae bacterium]|nr:MAG: methyltransferase domain-containing protein [Nitrospirota bacterium]